MSESTDVSEALERIIRSSVDLRLKRDPGDTELHAFLHQLESSLQSLWHQRKQLRGKRPKGCSCYRVNLRDGTASTHCHICPSFHYPVMSSPELHDVQTAISRLAGYNLNWDELGAAPFLHETIMFALQLSDVLGAGANVIPNSDGSIDFEIIDEGRYAKRINVSVEEITR